MSYGLHLLSALFIGLSGMILVCTKDVLSLQTQFVGYAIFHQDHVNKLAHELCVWPILWTFYCMFHHSRPVVPGLPFTNHAFFAAIMYASYYLLLNSGPLEGTPFTYLGAGLIVFCWMTSGLVAYLSPRLSGYMSAVINILCWVAQFYTHGKHEGRAPALTKNPAQAFFLAPLFVLLEGLSDRGVGEYKAKLALVQPSVDEGVRLLDAGKYAQVSQLDFQPMLVLGGLCYVAALFLLPMLNKSGDKLKATSSGSDAGGVSKTLLNNGGDKLKST